MNSLRIKTLALIIVSALLLSGVVFISSSVVIRSNVSEADQFWRSYQDDSSAKARALEALVTNLGFGGMIHQFKNYVLRQDTPRVKKIITAAGGALAALKQYEASGINPAEAKAIEDIKGVIDLYVSNMEMVQGLAESGSDAASIDGVVKISDKPALAGIAVLMQAVRDDRQSTNTSVTKTELLFRIRADMGYGSMIHQFKNYVLRKDTPRIEKIQKGAANALATIEEYRNLEVTPAEQDALNNIAGVVNAYITNLDKAVKLASEGKTPEEIDGTVKINDKPALQGMNQLVTEIAKQNQTKRSSLTSSLYNIQILALTIMIVAVLTAVILTILSVWALNFKIVRPIRKITNIMTDLAQGNVDIELEEQKYKNEIGEIAKAVIVFRDNKLEADRLVTIQTQEQETQAKRGEKLESISQEFDNNVRQSMTEVKSASSAMRNTAEGMSSTAQQTTQQASAVAAAAVQASTNLQAVASASEELTSSISEIGRQVEQSAGISTRAVNDAHQTDQKIRSLAEAANKIGAVVALITDIADQTNLLALNATIEAARAGEAGKGFAVVASEVKVLASQTAKATDEISSQINDIQKTTSESVDAIQSIGSTIGELSEITTQIASAVEQQGAATQEIAGNIEQAAAGTNEVTMNITGVNQSAEKTVLAANEVMSAVSTLTSQSDNVSGQVESFLGGVRAI